MAPKGHEATGRKFGMNAAGRIGENEPLCAEFGGEANRCRDCVPGVPFVEVRTAEEHERRRTPPFAHTKPTGVAADRCRSEAGEVGEVE